MRDVTEEMRGDLGRYVTVKASARDVAGEMRDDLGRYVTLEGGRVM